LSVTTIAEITKHVGIVDLDAEIPILHGHGVVFSSLLVFRIRANVNGSLNDAGLRRLVQVIIINITISLLSVDHNISLCKAFIDNISE